MAVERINPTSPVPLYRQIAESIHIRIKAIELVDSTLRRERTFEARYVFDAAKLNALGDALKW